MAFSHIIKSNSIIRNQRYFIFYDTETQENNDIIKREIGNEIKDIKRLSLKLGWVVLWDRKLNKEDWFYFEDSREFWCWIFKKIEEYNIKKLWVYAHNQDFDFKVVNGLSLLNENGWTCSFCNFDNPFIISFDKNGKRIQILDTMNYLKLSVKDIGNILNLKKLSIDFEDSEKETLKQYCKRDVEIIYNFIKQFIAFLSDNNLGSLKQTIAGTSFKCFTHRFMKDNIFVHNYKKAIDLERDSYRGGRVEAFYLGDIPEYVYDLDVNSMYPYVMLNKYPCKLISYSEKIMNGEDFKRFYMNAKAKGYLVIADLEFSLSQNSNNIGVKINIDGVDILVYPYGFIKTPITSSEIDYVLNNGTIIKCYRVALYEGKYIFKDFVNYFYKLKQKSDSDGNLVYYMLSKMILNSLYGKFGQKNYKKEMIKFKDGRTNIIEYKSGIDNVDGKIQNIDCYRLGVVGFYESSEYDEGINSFVAISSFASAYARMYLGYLIDLAGKENVYYCDTDSIFTNKLGYDNINNNGLIGSDIGKLKVEKEGYLTINGCKDYVFNDIEKIKGIKKNAIKLKNGIYEQERFIRLRTAIQYGFTRDQYVYTETKKLNRRYKKGIVMNNDIMPICLAK